MPCSKNYTGTIYYCNNSVSYRPTVIIFGTPTLQETCKNSIFVNTGTHTDNDSFHNNLVMFHITDALKSKD